MAYRIAMMAIGAQAEESMGSVQPGLAGLACAGLKVIVGIPGEGA